MMRLLLVAALAFAADEKSWQSKMSQLSGAIADAIPYLYPDPGQDPKGLNEKVAKIYEISKQLDVKFDHAQKVGDYDPALPYLAGMLKQDIERAYQGLQDGNAEYAKAVIRSSTAYCIACHTRTKSGAEFPLLAAFEKPLKSASWVTRIEFQAASRQFDSVLKEVTTRLGQAGDASISPLDLERGARIALAISIRVKRDPAKAKALAQAVVNSKSASFSMKEGAKVWLADIADWQNEKDRKFGSDQEMLGSARILVEKARSGTGPVGGHSEVKFLRASVLMHDMIRMYPKSLVMPEGLYIIGLAYGELQDLGLWSLHEMYFMACIEKSPHTRLSEQCYKEYEESVTLGYSGSSGTHIPAAVKKHLETLKKQASVP